MCTTCVWVRVREGVCHEGSMYMCWKLYMSVGGSMTEKDNKGTPESM